MRRYLLNILIAFDQLVNTILTGYPDETLSARAYRLDIERNRKWPRVIIDGLFFWQNGHCEQAYIAELNRLHISEKYDRGQ